MSILRVDVTMVMSRMPESASSRMVCSSTGLSPTGSISLGRALVRGSSRVPKPATGITALRIIATPASSADGGSYRGTLPVASPRIRYRGLTERVPGLTEREADERHCLADFDERTEDVSGGTAEPVHRVPVYEHGRAQPREHRDRPLPRPTRYGHRGDQRHAQVPERQVEPAGGTDDQRAQPVRPGGGLS